MTATPHLGITLLEQSQQQKEVTINEALYRLDAMLNSGAIDRDLATPPGSPSDGDVYIVANSPTGAWSGKATYVAYYDQIWRFIEPKEGLMLWVSDENTHVVYDGSAWNVFSSGGGSGDMSTSTYDPANIAQQLVGTTATQTLTNKTLTSPTLTAPSADGLIVTGSTVPANGMYLPTTNTLGFSSNSTVGMVLDANHRFVVGNGSAFDPGLGASSPIQSISTALSKSGVQASTFSADANGSLNIFSKSRNATIGGNSIVQSGDLVGGIDFCAANGTGYNNCATIRISIDGTPGASNDMPGRISFSTTADGAGSTTESLRIDNAGACFFPRVSTTASAANAFLNSSSSPANSLLRSTSSIAYKRDVEDLDETYSSKLFELRPVWYRSKAKADNPAWSWYGLIAEEVAKIDPRLVHWSYPEIGTQEVEHHGTKSVVPIYGEQLVPDGVQYERLTVLLLAELKKLKAEVAALKAMVA